MSKGTILVVEDNPMNLEIATDLLEVAGYTPIAAEDAEAAIKQVKGASPDLILLDLHLPGKDGYETCRLIQAMPEYRGAPIIAFTALAMADDHKKAYESGCMGIISKPIDVEKFASTVAGFLNGHHQQDYTE